MLNDYLLRQARHGAIAALGVAALAFAAACGSDSDTGTGISPTDAPKTYNQVQRLGNPLVSEVLLLKRDHGFHGSSNPSDDVANFTAPVKAFVAQFRPAATGLQGALAATLLPDMLQVQTDQAQGTDEASIQLDELRQEPGDDGDEIDQREEGDHVAKSPQDRPGEPRVFHRAPHAQHVLDGEDADGDDSP